ncbi:MAG: M60 family metallopeptidase [Planctomycetota bacterium]
MSRGRRARTEGARRSEGISCLRARRGVGRLVPPRRLLLLALLATGLPSVGAGGAEMAAPPLDAALILEGVTEIHGGGNPASVLAWGSATPLLVGPDGEVLAAAGTIGSGRVVVLGHGSFVGDERGDTPRFIANALEWLAGTAAAGELQLPRVPPGVAALLVEEGRTVSVGELDSIRCDLGAVDVVIGSPQAWRRAGRFAELRRWLEAGGGMLVTETAWGVLQLDRALDLDTLAANELLEAAGIRFTRDAHSPFGAGEGYPILPARLAVGNASHALALLAGAQDGDRELAGRVCARAFAGAPLDGDFLREARALRDDPTVGYGEAIRSLGRRRITAKESPLHFALLDLDARLASDLPVDEVTAHPTAGVFPGPLGEARLEVVEVSIDPAVPGWHSTGLHVPPGEVVEVRLRSPIPTDGWSLQVGAWRDPHQHDHRRRLKSAIRRFPVEAGVTRVASAIGGPLYLDLPPGMTIPRSAEEVLVRVSGAAPMPVYRRGVTDPAEWRERIRSIEAPFAEFISDSLVLTVPSSAIREVEDPERVMAHWDRVHEVMQSLEPRSPTHWADRPYRYVADVSVSWGYMYCPSNGPIVIPSSAAAAMFQPENFDGEGPNRLWGHYHEMGHAHKNPLWTDRTTSEVTVNIFTVLALHEVNGFPLDSPEMRTEPARAWRTWRDHRATGRRYEEVGGAFPRLQFYALLWHAFGFEAFHRAFDSIREAGSGGRRGDIVLERNRFLVHFGEAVERDLSEYGASWGMQVTDETRERLARFPSWLPAEPATERGSGKGSALR